MYLNLYNRGYIIPSSEFHLSHIHHPPFYVNKVLVSFLPVLEDLNLLQQDAVQTISWPSMSPDVNPIEHVWDFIGRKINQRNPKCQNIDELRTAILQEWQQFPQDRLGRLVRSMTRRVTELHNKGGGV
jgi:hypothetical protein